MCFIGHHKRKQEKEREEALKKAQEAASYQSELSFMSPRLMGPRFSQRQQFRSPAGMRHQPYPVARPIRAGPVRLATSSPSSIKHTMSGDAPIVKLEPTDNDETSNQSAGDTQGSDASSSSQTNETNDKSSIIPNEAGTEGLSLGADLSNLISDSDNQSANPSNSDNPDPNVKIEAISESEMELEITGVEPGHPVMSQDWGPDTSMGMGYDPMGATGSPGDMAAAQQGYSKCLITITDFDHALVLRDLY